MIFEIDCDLEPHWEYDYKIWLQYEEGWYHIGIWDKHDKLHFQCHDGENYKHEQGFNIKYPIRDRS